jgi:CsoR family transcriptional regulator, copper-sensing transcriptional repressor
VSLHKIEGLVQGLRQMLEEHRYCLEELQKANAFAVGAREVALLIMVRRLEAGIEFAADSTDVPKSEPSVRRR